MTVDQFDKTLKDFESPAYPGDKGVVTTEFRIRMEPGLVRWSIKLFGGSIKHFRLEIVAADKYEIGLLIMTYEFIKMKKSDS